MRRPLLLLVALPVLAGCGITGTTTVTTTLQPAHAASPQRAELGWVESFGDKTGRVVFGVDSFEVTKKGWRASLTVQNDTAVPFALGLTGVPNSLEFGLMLFSTGAHSELEQRNAARTLPEVRQAETYAPALPAQLGAHQTWTGTISGGGPVAAGTWVRIVFGTMIPVTVVTKGSSKPTPELPDALRKANVGAGGLTWITDHAYELKR